MCADDFIDVLFRFAAVKAGAVHRYGRPTSEITTEVARMTTKVRTPNALRIGHEQTGVLALEYN